MGFLLGWLAGILVAVVLFTLLSSVLPQQDSSGSSPVSGVIKIILGALLLFLAAKQWRARPAEGEQAAMPKWMSAIDSMTAIKGSGLACSRRSIRKPVTGDFGRSDHRRREPELG